MQKLPCSFVLVFVAFLAALKGDLYAQQPNVLWILTEKRSAGGQGVQGARQPDGHQRSARHRRLRGTGAAPMRRHGAP